MNTRRLTLFVSFFAFVLCLPNFVSASAVEPGQILRQFLDLDLEGKTLSTDGWGEVARLTTWEDAPGWDSLVVVKSFKVIPLPDKEADKKRFQVRYKELGHLADVFVVAPKEAEVIYELVKIDNSWKVSSPQLPPHVGYETAMVRIDRLVEAKTWSLEKAKAAKSSIMKAAGK